MICTYHRLITIWISEIFLFYYNYENNGSFLIKYNMYFVKLFPILQKLKISEKGDKKICTKFNKFCNCNCLSQEGLYTIKASTFEKS